MKILLYGINFSPELTGIGKYSGEMARWWAGLGHEVRVVTAPPYYPDWKVRQDFASWSYRKHQVDGLTVIRCPLYVPSKPTALKRLLHLASFSLSSSCAVMSQLTWKPDCIVLVVPTLFCAPPALIAAKLTGAKSIVHIQDYEVDAMFGLDIVKAGIFKRIAFAVERFTLRAFDQVSSISIGMLKRAVQKGVREEKMRFFPNWSETARFRNISRSPELLKDLGIDPDKRVLLYSGNIGEKQGLETLVCAAQRMSDQSDIVFLVVGEGAGKARLIDQVRESGLHNVVFAPLQPYEQLPSLLASADCHLVIQKRGVADAVLPSKLTNILAVGGNAVITADPDTSLGRLCEEHPGIAVCVEPESANALVYGIWECLKMKTPNLVASDYASAFLDKDAILTKFTHELDPLSMSIYEA